MEFDKNINQNPMPRFEIVKRPHPLKRLAKWGHAVLDHIPVYDDYDESMNRLDDLLMEDRYKDVDVHGFLYEGEQLDFGFDETGEFVERDDRA